jgi:hypothetical protein
LRGDPPLALASGAGDAYIGGMTLSADTRSLLYRPGLLTPMTPRPGARRPWLATMASCSCNSWPAKASALTTGA